MNLPPLIHLSHSWGWTANSNGAVVARRLVFVIAGSFTPSHTLVLYTNHLPKVGAVDRGIWRRLIVVPFEAKIEGSSDVKNYGDVLYEQSR